MPFLRPISGCAVAAAPLAHAADGLITVDPAWIAQRHDVADCPAVGKLSKALGAIAAAATAK